MKTKEIDVIRASGLKITPIRTEIFRILASAKMPLSCEEILSFLGGKKSHRSANLVTVYRNMNLFAQKGLVTRTNLGSDRAHFELVRGAHRHHIICTECKEVTPLRMCGLENHMQMVRELGFEHVHHRLEFYGICRKCC